MDTAACTTTTKGSLTPSVYTLTYRPFRRLRWALSRALLLLAFSVCRTAIKLLTKDHPVRVMMTGRLEDIETPVTEALRLDKRVLPWVAETTVFSGLLILMWAALDGFFNAEAGPVDLLIALV